VDQQFAKEVQLIYFSKTALNDSTEVIWRKLFNAPSNDWQTSSSSTVGNIAASRWSLVNYGYCSLYIRSNDELYFYIAQLPPNGSVTTQQKGEVTNSWIPSFSTANLTFALKYFLYLGYEKDSISMVSQMTTDQEPFTMKIQLAISEIVKNLPLTCIVERLFKWIQS
jgi:hypothetical protein